jgi:DNA-binding MarR family transcriptional regulator
MAHLKDQFNQCLFFASAATARALARIADVHFKAFDLSPTQGFILISIREAPGINVSDLALVLALDASTVTKTLEKMAFKELVQRETINKNVRIFLTGKGEEREADARAAWKKTRLAYTKLVGETEVRKLCEALTAAQDDLMDEDSAN